MNRSYYEGFVDDPVEPPPPGKPAPAPAGPLVPVPPSPYDGPYPPEPARPTRPHDPPAGRRPRSVPPPYHDLRRRPRRRSPSSSSSSSSACLPERARGLIKDNFTDSRAGVGVGILGALVGGIVAHGVSGASAGPRHRKSHGGRSDAGRDAEKARRFATVAGAVVGGLGANAMEKRFEESRRRERMGRDDWVRKWGEDGGFWQSDWDPPFDQPRGRSRRRGTEEYEVVYEEKRPRRKSGDPYPY